MIKKRRGKTLPIDHHGRNGFHSHALETGSDLVIVHQGALGDFLLALPVFDGLHRLQPEVKLHFWSKPKHVQLLTSKPYLGRLGNCDGPELTAWFHDQLWEQAALPAFFASAHGIFILGQSGSRILAERLARRLSCPVLWVASFPTADTHQPVTRFLVDQIRQAGWPIEQTVPVLDPCPHEIAEVELWLRETGRRSDGSPVLLHPGSGGWRKVWPLQRWWDLMRWLRDERDLPVVVLCGPADDYLLEFVRSASRLGARVAEGFSLPRLAALLAAGRLFVGNDSGVTHLAAAVGTPTLAIFGKTPPEVWAPRGLNVKVVRSQWEESDILAFQPGTEPQALEQEIRGAVKVMLGR